jgi:hypothetical protein
MALGKVTIHKGTLYRVEIPDGTLGPKQAMPEDVEVELLATSEQYRVYFNDDGTFLYVEPGDEADPAI